MSKDGTALQNLAFVPTRIIPFEQDPFIMEPAESPQKGLAEWMDRITEGSPTGALTTDWLRRTKGSQEAPVVEGIVYEPQLIVLRWYITKNFEGYYFDMTLDVRC